MEIQLSQLTIKDMLKAVERVEKDRQSNCRRAAKSYILKKCREAGMTLEEYDKVKSQKAYRGRPRKYFPDSTNQS
jgi:hypothetical protein